MKKFKIFLAGFILFVYENYIREEWDIYNKWAKPIAYIGWLYRAIVIWIFSFIFLPEYIFKQSDTYKEIKKIQNSKEYKEMMAKTMGMFKFQI